MTGQTVLEFTREGFNFSIAHFTIFSETHRERWHGHNYFVSATVRARFNEAGILFDYGLFKNKLRALCDRLDLYFILPQRSPHLHIQELNDYYEVDFNREKMIFLKKDVLLLPIENTTLEEFSRWFLEELLSDRDFIDQYGIDEIIIKVSNGSFQNACLGWENKVTNP